MKQAGNKRFLFLLYSILLLLLLFGRRSRAVLGLSYPDCLKQNINMLPFRSIRGEIRLIFERSDLYFLRYAVVNLFGNIVLFIPFGVLLPLCFEKYRRFGAVLTAGALVVLAVETVQLFTLRGSFDIDDLILNLLGIAVGYGVYKWITKNGKG